MKEFDVCTAKHLSVDGDVDANGDDDADGAKCRWSAHNPNGDNDANGDWCIIPMAVMMPIMIGTKCQW